jgi:hypothetical protein
LEVTKLEGKGKLGLRQIRDIGLEMTDREDTYPTQLMGKHNYKTLYFQRHKSYFEAIFLTTQNGDSVNGDIINHWLEGLDRKIW